MAAPMVLDVIRRLHAAHDNVTAFAFGEIPQSRRAGGSFEHAAAIVVTIDADLQDIHAPSCCC